MRTIIGTHTHSHTYTHNKTQIRECCGPYISPYSYFAVLIAIFYVNCMQVVQSHKCLHVQVCMQICWILRNAPSNTPSIRSTRARACALLQDSIHLHAYVANVCMCLYWTLNNCTQPDDWKNKECACECTRARYQEHPSMSMLSSHSQDCSRWLSSAITPIRL